MAEGQKPGRWRRLLDFLRRLALLVGITVAVSLVVWLVFSLFQGHFDSPSGVFFWATLPHFGIAAGLILFDTGSSLAVPVKMLRAKEDRAKVLDEARQRSERGMSYTFLFFSAGATMLLLSILTGTIFGG